MVTYTLSDARNRHGEVFDHAMAEPVLLTKNSRPSHVVLAAGDYQALLARLKELEDRTWGEAAARVLADSSMVGTEGFTAALKRLAEDA
jgi:prevent-host-death family protein